MTKKNNKQQYLISNKDTQKKYTESRSAEKWIPFFMPYLMSGYKVLDCGCGVGSITLDIARIVYPGEVIGIDIDSRQLEIGSLNAKKNGISNIKFIEADIFDLPFIEESFDAVLAHTLLIHLNDQLSALKIIYKMLRPGGVACVSDDDWGTAVQSPDTPLSGKNIELMARVLQYQGGNPYYSRNLRSLFVKAGFIKNAGYAAAPEYYGTLEETRLVASVVNGMLKSPEFSGIVIKNKWATQKEIDELISENQRWAELPDSFAAHIYCAAIGWKPEEK